MIWIQKFYVLKYTSLSSQDEAFDEAWYENEALKEKINGLKQQYGPIGQQVHSLQMIYDIYMQCVSKKEKVAEINIISWRKYLLKKNLPNNL